MYVDRIAQMDWCSFLTCTLIQKKPKHYNCIGYVVLKKKLMVSEFTDRQTGVKDT